MLIRLVFNQTKLLRTVSKNTQLVSLTYLAGDEMFRFDIHWDKVFFVRFFI